MVAFRALSRHATDPIGLFAIKPVHFKLLIVALQTEVAPAGKLKVPGIVDKDLVE